VTEENRIEIPAGARTAEAPAAPATLPHPPLMESTGTGKPSAEQLEAWIGRAQRIAPFTTARQLVVAIEVEIWVNDDRAVSPMLVEALETYLDQGTGLENGAETVLKNGVTVRHRFVNRYYEGGKLIATQPPVDMGPPVVASNDPRLQA